MAKKKIRKSKAKKVKKSKKKTMKKKAKKTKKSRTKKAARKVKKSKKKVRKGKKGKKKAMRKPGRVKASAKAGALGKVIHYYDKIGVGIVKMAGSLRVGESVVFKRGPEEFAQQVTSMQVDHTPVNEAKKGQIIGLKVNQPVRDGAVVMKA